jgi:hypothetical protein
MQTDTDGFFGGAPALSFKDPAWKGVIRGGLVVAEPRIGVVTEMKSHKVATWDDGSPKQQMIVELRCDGAQVPGTSMRAHDERDPTNPRDNGVRRLYIKSHMVKAVGAALREANETSIRMGGYLFIAWTDEKETDLSNAKLYASKWFAPAVSLPGTGPEQAAQGDPFGGAAMTGPPAQQVSAPSKQVHQYQQSEQYSTPVDPWASGTPLQQPSQPAGNPFG